MTNLPQISDLPFAPLASTRQIPAAAGIYVISSKTDLLYIGESCAIKRRLQSHQRRKEFLSYSEAHASWYLVEDEEVRADIEYFWINKYHPKLNASNLRRLGKHPSKGRPVIALSFKILEAERVITDNLAKQWDTTRAEAIRRLIRDAAHLVQ